MYRVISRHIREISDNCVNTQKFNTHLRAGETESAKFCMRMNNVLLAFFIAVRTYGDLARVIDFVREF